MATTATKAEHSATTHTSHANTNSSSNSTSGAHKTAAKTSGKRRGGYSFGTSGAGETKTTASKKGTRRGSSSARNSTSASGNRASSTAGRSGRSGLDLGFASIAKSASDTTRQNAQKLNNAANKTSSTFNGAFANVASNAKQMQEKVSSFGREVSNNLSQSASRAAESTNRSLEMHRANAEALGQSYSAAQEAMKEASQEIFNFFNNAFTQNVEAARQALECRNIGELFQIHNDLAKQNIESAFEQALRMSEIAIETATSAIEPINDSVTKNSRKYAKYNS